MPESEGGQGFGPGCEADQDEVWWGWGAYLQKLLGGGSGPGSAELEGPTKESEMNF